MAHIHCFCHNICPGMLLACLVYCSYKLLVLQRNYHIDLTNSSQIWALCTQLFSVLHAQLPPQNDDAPWVVDTCISKMHLAWEKLLSLHWTGFQTMAHSVEPLNLVFHLNETWLRIHSPVNPIHIPKEVRWPKGPLAQHWPATNETMHQCFVVIECNISVIPNSHSSFILQHPLAHILEIHHDIGLSIIPTNPPKLCTTNPLHGIPIFWAWYILSQWLQWTTSFGPWELWDILSQHSSRLSLHLSSHWTIFLINIDDVRTAFVLPLPPYILHIIHDPLELIEPLLVWQARFWIVNNLFGLELFQSHGQTQWEDLSMNDRTMGSPHLWLYFGGRYSSRH